MYFCHWLKMWHSTLCKKGIIISMPGPLKDLSMKYFALAKLAITYTFCLFHECLYSWMNLFHIYQTDQELVKKLRIRVSVCVFLWMHLLYIWTCTERVLLMSHRLVVRSEWQIWVFNDWWPKSREQDGSMFIYSMWLTDNKWNKQ